MAVVRDGVDVEMLEGDEGEPEVGRHHDVGADLLRTPIADVRRSAAAVVAPDAPVQKAVDLMRARNVSAVVVVERKKTKRVVGIFTERDLVNRALPSRAWARSAVEKHMTRAPETLRMKDPVAYAINKMSVGGFRHVPLVDDEGRAAGIISATDLVRFLVELCPEELLNLPPEPELAVHPTAEGE